MRFDYDADSGPLTPRQTISTLPPGFAGSNFCSEILVSADGKFVYAGNRLHDSIGIFVRRPGRRPEVRRRGMDARELPAELRLRPHRRVPLLLQPAGGQRHRLPRGSQDRRPHLHRPLHPRRQPVVHRVPRPEDYRSVTPLNQG